MSSQIAIVDVGPLLDEGRWSGYQKLAVACAALAIVFDGVDIQLIGIALPAIMKDWQLARAAFAPVLAIGIVGMIVGAMIGGMVGDRYGRRVALIGCVTTFGVLTAAMSQADGLVQLGLFRFLSAVGLGGAMPNATALASEYVPTRLRALAVTMTIVCVPLGGTLAGIVGAEVLPSLGWRNLFLFGGLAPLALGVALFWMLPESPRFLAARESRWHDLRAILARSGKATPEDATFVDTRELKLGQAPFVAILSPEFRRDTLLLWSAFLCCLLAVYCAFNWLPSLLTSTGLTQAVASRGLASFNLGGVLGALVAALLIGRFGSKSTLVSIAALGVAGAVALMMFPLDAGSNVVEVIALIAFTGAAINAVQTTMYALAAFVYPTSVRATGVGSASAVGRFGAIVSSYLGAWSIDVGGSRSFFFVIALAMTGTLIAIAFVQRHVPAARPGT
jgi:MFS transporter, AAHS family, 4-hydroxybenzoate transporter